MMTNMTKRRILGDEIFQYSILINICIVRGLNSQGYVYERVMV